MADTVTGNACDICGGFDFANIAGRYYCIECSTQSQAMEEIEHEVQLGSLHVIHVRKEQGKEKGKGPASVGSWTNVEAFQYILLHMLKVLQQSGAFSDGDCQLTKKLWICYLARTGRAFMQGLSCYKEDWKIMKKLLSVSDTYRDAYLRADKAQLTLPNKRKRKISALKDEKDDDVQVEVEIYRDSLSLPQMVKASINTKQMRYHIGRLTLGKLPSFLMLTKMLTTVDEGICHWEHLLNCEVPINVMSKCLRQCQEFKLLANDAKVFHAGQAFVQRNHVRTSCNLGVFLGINQLPNISLMVLVKRYCEKLFLPDQIFLFVEILFSDVQFCRKLLIEGNVNLEIPDVYAISLIVMCMKIIVQDFDHPGCSCLKKVKPVEQCNGIHFDFISWIRELSKICDYVSPFNKLSFKAVSFDDFLQDERDKSANLFEGSSPARSKLNNVGMSKETLEIIFDSFADCVRESLSDSKSAISQASGNDSYSNLKYFHKQQIDWYLKGRLKEDFGFNALVYDKMSATNVCVCDQGSTKNVYPVFDLADRLPEYYYMLLKICAHQINVSIGKLHSTILKLEHFFIGRKMPKFPRSIRLKPNFEKLFAPSAAQFAATAEDSLSLCQFDRLLLKGLRPTFVS